MIYPATAKGPFKASGYYDPNSKRIIGLIYRPDPWAASTTYYVRSADDYDVAVPTVPNGFYYKVTNPGNSGLIEPTWPTTVGATVTLGATYEAVAYNLLPPTQSITLSTFTASDGVTLTTPTFTATKTQVMISAVPAAVTQFTITNHTVRSNGEEEDVSILFKVAER